MKKQTSAATIVRLLGAVFLLGSFLLFVRVMPVMGQHGIKKSYTGPATPAAAQSLVAHRASAPAQPQVISVQPAKVAAAPSEPARFPVIDTPQNCIWSSSTVASAPILDQAVASLGSNLYMFSGVSSGVIVANSYKFDGTTWTPIMAYPLAVEYPSAVSDGTQYIYIMNGVSSGPVYQTAMYRYDTVANTYTVMASNTVATWNQSAVYLNGKIYKTGGFNSAAAGQTALEIYDVASNTWSLGASLPTGQGFGSAWAQGNFIYFAGGIVAAGTTLAYRYDVAGNSWTPIANLPATRWGAASAFYGDSGALVGGYVGGDAATNVSNTAIYYDAGSNMWVSLPNALAQRSRMNGAVLGGSFYVIGGRSNGDTTFNGTADNQKLTCSFVPTPVILPAGSTLQKENCSPSNGVLDPGETDTISFCVQNAGNLNTINLVGTLLVSGGVTNPSGPQNYGVVIAGGASVCGSFTFTAGNTLQCGGALTATIQFQDGATNLGNASYNFTLGTNSSVFSQNFDGVMVPMLPAGWTADQGVNVAGAPLWVTSNSGVPTPVADSLPNAAFTQDPANTCDNRIYTPSILYTAGSRLSFRQNYDLEQSSATLAYDAGVLEMSINGGAYTDIVTAGGSFATGGYNHTDISTGFSNPLLPSRPNWSGFSNGGAGGFETCTVNLPASGAGQPVQFRWRMGSDSTVSHNGWRIDNVTILQPVCCQAVLDHFKAYQLPTPTPLPLNVQVMLRDQFDFPNFQTRTVLEPFRFANPVDKDRNGTITPRTNPDEHLKLYNLSPVAGPTPIRVVDVYNQFGPQRLTVQGSKLLAVPTIKNGVGVLQNLDHFQCYDCTGPALNVVVNLTDQFHFEPNVTVLQPRYFCNPVVKIHNGTTPILHPASHLVFYAINPQPPFSISVSTSNQFGAESLALKEADLLGVPSVKQIVLTGAVSRKIHGGAGTYDVTLPLTGTPGIECRSGQGAGGTDHQMVVTFLNPVTVGGAAVTSGTGSVVGGPIVSSNVVTINLTGVTNAQTIRVTLSNVSDGANTSNWTVPMSVLQGDTSGNGAVSGTDASQTKLQSGQPVTVSNFREDVVVSGAINVSDVSAVKLKSGTALP